MTAEAGATGVVTLAGSRVHYWLSGPANGPLVVLTHGASMDHRMFDLQLPALHEAGYRTLTWDIRGHGQSKPIGDTPIRLSDLAEDLLGLLDHLAAPSPVCLLGHSLGGLIAQQLLYAYPAHVSALALIGARSITAALSTRQRWAFAVSPWWFRVCPQWLRQKGIATATARDPAVREYTHTAAGQLSKSEFLAIWGAVANVPQPDPEYRMGLPVLMTHGDLDRTGNVARTALGWAEHEPNAHYAVIAPASHNANQDQPAQFNRILVGFLAEHYPTDRLAAG